MRKKFLAPAIVGLIASGLVVLAQTGVPISSLPSVPTLTGGEFFPIVRNGVTYKATPNQVRAVASTPVNGTWTGAPIGQAYGGAGTIVGVLKGSGTGTVSAAVAGIDFAPATSGSALLAGNGAGLFTNVNIGTGLSYSAGTLSASAAGTVTSVGLSLPGTIFTITNSPVTTSGTLTGTLVSQSANQFFAGPSGSAGAPSFRTIVSADLTGSFTGITAVGTLTSLTSSGNIGAATFSSTALADFNNIRATGSTVAASGSGLELLYSGGTGYVQAYNRTGSVYLPINLSGSSATVAAQGGASLVASSGGVTVTSAGSSAFSAGANGASNPAFQVDASTASSVNGVKIKSGVAGGGAVISTVSSSTNDHLYIDAKGTGQIVIAANSSGAITLSRATTLATITGSTQCLQVNTGGVVSGSGSGCGVPSAAAGTVTAAATTDLSTSPNVVQTVTGNTTITSFGTGANLQRTLIFTGTPLLTNSATLITGKGRNIQAAPGDVATLISDNSGTPIWRVVTYTPFGQEQSQGWLSAVTTSPSNMGTLNLTPGRWLLYMTCQTNGSGAPSDGYTRCGLSANSASYTGTVQGTSWIYTANYDGAAGNPVGSGSLGPFEVIVTSNTPYYCVMNALSSSVAVFGSCRAERVY